MELDSNAWIGRWSDHPRLPAGGKFPKSRSPVKASLEWTALLKLVGVNTLVQAP